MKRAGEAARSLAITKNFIDLSDEPLPDWAIEPVEDFFHISVHYTSLASDGSKIVKDVKLWTDDDEVKHVKDSGIYTWTIPDIAPGTEVNIHEDYREEVFGYSIIRSKMDMEGDGICIFEENANFSMPDEDSSFSITNTYEAWTGQLKLVKVWEDSGDVDGKRPDSLTLTLTATKMVTGEKANVFEDGEGKSVNIKSVELTKKDNWKATLKDLKVCAEGDYISYKVTEDSIPEGYTASVDESELSDGTFMLTDERATVTVTNTHQAASRIIRAKKIWADDTFFESGDEGRKAAIGGYERPKDVSVNLFADGTAVGKARGLSDKNDWTTEWTVPVNKDGKAIQYEVKEINTPTGYSYSGDVVVTGTGDFEAIITNTPKEEEVLSELILMVCKTDDINEPLEGASFQLTDPQGKVAGNYSSDKDGKITLSLTGTGSYKLVETNAPAGYDKDSTEYTINVDKKLGEIRLSTAEGVFRKIHDLIFGTNQPENFDPATNTLTIVNRAGSFKVKLTKTFAGLPESLIPEDSFRMLVMYKNTNGENLYPVLTLKDDKIEKSISPEGISYTWTIDNIRLKSNVIIMEDSDACQIPGYTWTVENDEDKSTSMIIDGIAEDKELSFINSYIEDTGSVKAEKIFNDNNNQDGIRPAAVTFTLTGENSEGEKLSIPEAEKTVTIEKGAADGQVAGSAAWKDLPTHLNGKEISYTVKEGETEAYTTSYKGNGVKLEAGGEQTVTVINSSDTAKTDISVKKKWDDDYNKGGYRLDEVVFRLYADGEDTGRTVKLTAENDSDKDTKHEWTLEKAFTSLPVNKNGRAILYTVKEDLSLDLAKSRYTGWEKAADSAEDAYYTITNKLDKNRVSLAVSKEWDDENDRDGIRPGHQTFARDHLVLKANGVEMKPQPMSMGMKSGDNLYIIYYMNLPMYEEGEEGALINYTVEEKVVPEGYEHVSTQELNGGFIIKNRHVIKEETQAQKLTVMKVDENKEALAGAEFTLTTPGGMQKVYVSGSDGNVREKSGSAGTQTGIVMDEVGTYTLVETKVPEGYKLGNTYSWMITTEKSFKEKSLQEDAATSVWKYVITPTVRDAENFDPDTNTLTVENPPFDEYTVSFTDHGDPTRPGYSFIGWKRTVGEDGDVVYEAKWAPAEKIRITYTDGVEDEEIFKDVTTEIAIGEYEPAQPEDPVREGYRFGGWLRSQDQEAGEVCYTANWIEDPKKAVSYIDPLSSEEMFSQSVGLDSRGEPDESGITPPEDPVHEGFLFTGWTRRADAAGNIIYTASYESEPQKESKDEEETVKETKEKETQKATEKETEKESKKSSTASKTTTTGTTTRSTSPASTTGTAATTQTTASSSVKTGDEFSIMLYLGMFGLSTGGVITAVARRKRRRK